VTLKEMLSIMTIFLQTTLRLMFKPTHFMISCFLVLHVHVVATCCSHICNYRKGWTKF
jgi:hypothetical protein